jgi:hypothetical protein
MRLMESIRRKGHVGLWIFMVFMTISIFAGLGVGFNFNAGSRDQGPDQNSKQPKLDTKLSKTGAVMTVNGRPVSDKQFGIILANIKSQMNSSNADPWNEIYAYGYIINQMTQEEVLLGKAEELGATVSQADMDKARDDAITQYAKKSDAASGNIIGDLGQKIQDAREKKRAFMEFLEVSGFTQQEWEERVRRELLMDNTKKKLQEQADAKKKTLQEAKKKQVDDALAKGEAFADVAKKFSEDATADKGGDIGNWVGRGLLFDEKIANTVFSTPVNKMTEWFDIPAGFQRFEVYAKKEASGPEFEKEKPALIEKLKKDKGKDYKPTDEDIKKEYEAVKFRQILLKTTDEGAADTMVKDLIDKAVVEVNDPLMLAYQALIGDKLQPPASMNYDQLVQIAKNSDVDPGYDFTLIKTKLDKGRPAGAAPAPAADATKAAAPATPAADAAKTPGATDAKSTPAPAAGATDAAKPAETPAAEPKKIDMTPKAEEQPVPLYALAIGLLTKSLQDRGEQAGPGPYYMISKAYVNWLQDDKELKRQPINRDKARQDIAKMMDQAIKSLDYNSSAYALQGLNLAWLQKKDEAHKALDLAQKYAPQEPGDAWDMMLKAYQVLGDTDKEKQIKAISDKLRQEAFQKQINEMMQQQQSQGGGGQSTPIQIPSQ